MKPRTNNRIAWIACALLTGLVLVGVGVLVARMRPYWVAKYQGRGVDVHGSALRPLHGADLAGADLHGADLRRATR